MDTFLLLIVISYKVGKVKDQGSTTNGLLWLVKVVVGVSLHYCSLVKVYGRVFSFPLSVLFRAVSKKSSLFLGLAYCLE